MSVEGTSPPAARGVPLLAVARNAAFLFGSNGAARLVRFGYLAVLARALGPERLGLLLYSQSWYLLFVPLTALGTRALMARSLGANRETGADDANTILTLRLLLLPLIVAVCLATGLAAESNPTVRALLWTAGAALAARAVVQWTTQVFVACGTASYTLRQEMIFRPIEALAGITVVAVHGSVTAVAVVHAAVWWAQAVHGLHLARILLPVRPRWRPQEMRRIFWSTLTLIPVAFAGGWFLQAPISLIRHLGVEPSVLGWFALNMQCVRLLAGIPAAFGHAAIPSLSRAAIQSERVDARYLRRVIPVTIGGTALCALVGQAIGPWLVPLVFGGQFAAAGQWLGTMMTLLIPYSIALLYSESLIAVGCDRVAAIAAIVGVMVLLPAGVFLHTMWGVGGVIFGTGIAAAVWSLANTSRSGAVALGGVWSTAASLSALLLFGGAFALLAPWLEII